jgi:hypothetical protein
VGTEQSAGGLSHHRLMQSVIKLVQGRCNKLVIAGGFATPNDFVGAVKAVVAQVSKFSSNPSVWKYFSKLKIGPRKKEHRVPMNLSLELVLDGWCKLVASAGLVNVSNLDGIDERRRAADAFAKQKLKQLPKGASPNTATVVSALRLWAFEKNDTRKYQNNPRLG